MKIKLNSILKEEAVQSVETVREAIQKLVAEQRKEHNIPEAVDFQIHVETEVWKIKAYVSLTYTAKDGIRQVVSPIYLKDMDTPRTIEKLKRYLKFAVKDVVKLYNEEKDK